MVTKVGEAAESGRDRTIRMTPSGTWLRHRFAGKPCAKLGLLIVMAFVIRLPMLPLTAYVPGNGLEDLAWRQWMESIATHGILNVFRVSLTDYVGYHWILWLLTLVYGQMGGSYEVISAPPAVSPTLHLLLKAPPLVFDAVLILAMYAATRELSQRLTEAHRSGAALLAATVIALHPAALYDSVVWSQIDGGAAAAMLGSIALVGRGSLHTGWLVWALGFMLKPHPIIILPVLVPLTVRRFGWRGLAMGSGLVGLVAVLVTAPWVLHGDLRLILDTYAFIFRGSYYQGALSMGAWNPWWLIQIWTRDLSTDLAFGQLAVTYKQIGLACFASAALLGGALVWSRPSLRIALVAATYLAFAFYLLPTASHERYLYPFLVLLLPVAILDRRWWWLYVPISMTLFVNLVVVAPPVYELSGRWLESPLSLVVVVVHTALFMAFSVALLRGIRYRALLRSSLPACHSPLRRGSALPSSEAPDGRGTGASRYSAFR